MAEDPHIVRTAGLDWSQVWRGRHPFNPASEMQLASLGDPTGLKRVGVHLVRVPPGKESFIPHAHAVMEEFVFVLEGAGEVVLDGVAHALGPGDFVGFPTDGVVHCVRATGPGDLVYLTAGERTAANVEVAAMPTIGRTAVFRPGRMTLFGEDGVEELTEAEWFARTRLA
jgi:uncharacterized cupin superfamily protein